MDHLVVLLRNYKLDCDLSLHISRRFHKFRDMDRYISNLHMPDLEHIRNSTHILVGKLVDFLGNQEDRNKLHSHFRIQDIYCLVHMEKDHKD